MTIDIQGNFEPKFQPVIDSYLASFAEQPHGGSALAIYQHGKPVVNVWGGEWKESKLNVMFSVTKGLCAILVHRLVEEGLIDLNRKVSYYWPKFAAEGKGDATVAWVLQHQAGLSATRADFELEDVLAGDPIDEALAAQEPLWQPGTGHQYHAMTFGNLVGKLVSIVSSQSLGKAFQTFVAEPLKAEAWIGLPAYQELRVTTLTSDGKRQPLNAPVGSEPYWIEKAMSFGKAFIPGQEGPGIGFNNPKVHAAELGGAGGIATADSLARIWSSTVYETNGVRLMSDQTVAAATKKQVGGVSVFNEPAPYINRGNGFAIYTPGGLEYLSPAGFGHDGLGGQTGWADPTNGIGFAYLSDYLLSGPEERRRHESIGSALKQTLAELNS
ncbi:MAG: serine hydrolase domain-containing protein [Actinomycetes bacterium]